MNPGGGTGRHSVKPTAADAASERGDSTASKETGGAVNAGESRITKTGSDGGFSVPIDTTSPSEAYPGGGRGRHNPHAAAPTRELDTPSLKTYADEIGAPPADDSDNDDWSLDQIL